MRKKKTARSRVILAVTLRAVNQSIYIIWHYAQTVNNHARKTKEITGLFGLVMDSNNTAYTEPPNQRKTDKGEAGADGSQ